MNQPPNSNLTQQQARQQAQQRAQQAHLRKQAQLKPQPKTPPQPQEQVVNKPVEPKTQKQVVNKPVESKPQEQVVNKSIAKTDTVDHGEWAIRLPYANWDTISERIKHIVTDITTKAQEADELGETLGEYAEDSKKYKEAEIKLAEIEEVVKPLSDQLQTIRDVLDNCPVGGYYSEKAKKLVNVSEQLPTAIQQIDGPVLSSMGEIPVNSIKEVVATAIGTGERLQVFLPNVGVWVTLSPPSPLTMNKWTSELLKTLDIHNVNHHTIPYMLQATPFIANAFNLVASCVINTNINADNEVVISKKTMTIPDLEVLLMSIVASKHPKGYSVVKTCVECMYDQTVNINLHDTIHLDLPDELKNHEVYTNRSNQGVAVDEWMSYRKLVAERNEVTIQLVTAPGISVTYQTPSIEYIFKSSGHIHGYLMSLAQDVVTEDVNVEDVFANLLTVMHPGAHTLATKCITINGSKIPSTHSAIFEAYTSMADNPKLVKELEENLREVVNSGLSLIAMPEHSCPKCSKDDELRLIPMDVNNFFIKSLLASVDQSQDD